MTYCNDISSQLPLSALYLKSKHNGRKNMFLFTGYSDYLNVFRSISNTRLEKQRLVKREKINYITRDQTSKLTVKVFVALQ